MFLFLWMDTYLLFQSNKNILFVEVAVDYTLDIEKHLLFTVTVRVLIILQKFSETTLQQVPRPLVVIAPNNVVLFLLQSIQQAARNVIRTKRFYF